jgi:hypothetical protein
MSVKDEVVAMLQRGTRVNVPDEPVDEHLKAWATNLTKAYQELGDVAVKLAANIDRLQETVERHERFHRGKSIPNPGQR